MYGFQSVCVMKETQYELFRHGVVSVSVRFCETDTTKLMIHRIGVDLKVSAITSSH